MKPKMQVAGAVVAGMLSTALAVWAQAPEAPYSSPVIPSDGVSDIGSFEAVPFGGTGHLLLNPEEKVTMRKLEDKHIQERRALEDRYEKDLRALRARQYAERQQMLKSFVKR